MVELTDKKIPRSESVFQMQFCYSSHGHLMIRLFSNIQILDESDIWIPILLKLIKLMKFFKLNPTFIAKMFINKIFGEYLKNARGALTVGNHCLMQEKQQKQFTMG